MLGRQLIRLSARRTNTGALKRSGHGPELQEPTGYLFNRKPGEKIEPEGWEKIWFYGFYGAMLYGAVGLYFKPDTKTRTWARMEAEKRMLERGDTLEYKHTDYII
ncbi:hypothetical protein BB559_004276 [Furculomyces boomerangus]|uniref:NADH dehydrogenase [ubiquinone] 1 beta subcomplex subunit 11, mitochondrial n=2 Tax=Harpellales TaxID=61421 RepID=A0A2T9Y2D8_9FUNG|nr:hypothetical protein BB559_006497 [Furculomyces boomerangus]PVU91126.1 hypothetical protein BB559_004276 [Furculomyces boomerangus]PWA01465.1 hypothetical protein BB558_002435 [Smittium angustum]